MPAPADLDIAKILAAAYGRPDVLLDQLAAKVRARLALLETVGEGFRLLLEVPGAALLASLPASKEPADLESNKPAGNEET